MDSTCYRLSVSPVQKILYMKSQHKNAYVERDFIGFKILVFHVVSINSLTQAKSLACV